MTSSGHVVPPSLRQSLDICATLFKSYNALTAKVPVSAHTGQTMTAHQASLQDYADNQELNDLIVAARTKYITDTLRYGHRHHLFLGAGSSNALWDEESRIVEPHGIGQRELRRIRRESEKLLARRDPGAIHPLSGAWPFRELIASLHTAEVASVGKSQKKLGKPQREHRSPLVQSDFYRLRGCIFLLSGTLSCDGDAHLYSLSYAVAVADASR